MNPTRENKVVGDAKRGSDPYGNSNFAGSPALDVKPTIQIGSAHIGGDYVATPMKTASVTGPTGMFAETYDQTNLSAKFKYPRVTEDVPADSRTAKPGASI